MIKKYLPLLLLTFFLIFSGINAQENQSAQIPSDKIPSPKISDETRYEAAREQLTIAAQSGDLDAQYLLGEIAYLGLSGKEDNLEAFKWFSLAANQGSAPAQHRLAEIYYLGLLGEKDYEASIKWLMLAVEQAYPDAQGLLAQFYFYGNPLAQDYQKAHYWAEIAAKNESAAGNMVLGYLHFFGFGVPQNPKLGEQYAEKSALQGNAEGITLLGNIYYQYHLADPTQDWVHRAAEIYQIAAHQYNDGYAQYALATIYAKGETGQVDLNQALQLTILAEQSGVAEAQLLLAALYMELENPEQALEFAKKSCQNNVANACEYYQLIAP